MPKLTLLDMTQNILSDMDSDEVNTISDTVESGQVAEIIKTTYYDLIASKAIPEMFSIVQFEGLSNTAKPNFLQYPSTATEIQWFKYDSRDTSSDTTINYVDVQYLDPQTFMNFINNRDNADSNTTAIADSSGISLLIRTDKNPEYWTSFDDEFVVCDSYDSAIESTLQKSKTQAYSKLEPTFTLNNTFVPTLDVDLFPLLLATAKSVAFVTLKQQGNPAANASSRNHLVRQQNNRHRFRAANEVTYPDYGR
tara:strand:- start:2799 stop:3554 length:756 start_codon:yes stop_codon:yes gene_type:complete